MELGRGSGQGHARRGVRAEPAAGPIAACDRRSYPLGVSFPTGPIGSTCAGSDRDSTHSADVDCADLLPSLFELEADNFYVALAGERDRARVLGTRLAASALGVSS